MYAQAYLPSSRAEEPVVPTVLSSAASPAGHDLDRAWARYRRQVSEVLVDDYEFFPDVTFESQPITRTRHSGRVIWRDRPIESVEVPDTYGKSN